MNSDKLRAAVNGLDRIHNRVLAVESAIRRARTPGRVKQITGDSADGLDSWDSHQAEAAAVIGVDLFGIGHQAAEYVETIIAHWS